MIQVSLSTFYKNKTSKQIKKENVCEKYVQFYDTGEPFQILQNKISKQKNKTNILTNKLCTIYATGEPKIIQNQTYR